jgi:mono/diheme cytochrome c family protein
MNPGATHRGIGLAVGVMFAAIVVAAGGAGQPSRVLAGELPPDGAQLYRTYCASCHGNRATGDGPAAIAMKVPPPDLTLIASRNRGVFPAERVRQIIQGRGPAAHGERTMPVWGDVFARKVTAAPPAALVDALVRYLDGLQQRRGE